MTITLPGKQSAVRPSFPLTGPQLIHQVAAHVRAGQPIEDALNHALRDAGGHDRYVNLVADLCAALHQDEPANRYDVDHLATAGVKDHPAAYGERLIIWAATVGNPATVADRLDAVASRMARELAAALGGAA